MKEIKSWLRLGHTYTHCEEMPLSNKLCSGHGQATEEEGDQ